MKNIKYFLYTRKSTDEEERQVLSIELQIVELKEFAAKKNLKLLILFKNPKPPKSPAE